MISNLDIEDDQFSCDFCHDLASFELPASEENITWGTFKGYENAKCDECKMKCSEEENCAGVQCYRDEESKKSNLKQSLLSCQWRAKKRTDDCLSKTKDYMTCWKKT